MIGDLFVVKPSGSGSAAGAQLAQALISGAQSGQIGPVDQELMLQAAAQTPAGAALNTKQLAIAAAIAGGAGLLVGFLAFRRKR